MINYDEMDETIKSINEYVEKLKSLTEVESSLSTSTSKINGLNYDFNEALKSMDAFVNDVKSLEGKYSSIDESLKEAEQDYVKVRSSFELVETELKKYNNQQEEAIKTLDSLSKEIHNLYTNLEEDLRTSKRDHGAIIGISIGLVVLVLVVLVLVIVGLVRL